VLCRLSYKTKMVGAWQGRHLVRPSFPHGAPDRIRTCTSSLRRASAYPHREQEAGVTPNGTPAMVPPERFELPATWFEATHSIR
jgi:hypothetical protein